MSAWTTGCQFDDYDWAEAAKKNPSLVITGGLVLVRRSSNYERNSIGINTFNAEGKNLSKLKGRGYWAWAYYHYRTYPTFDHIRRFLTRSLDDRCFPHFQNVTFFETETHKEIPLDTPTTDYISDEVYMKLEACTQHEKCTQDFLTLGENDQ